MYAIKKFSLFTFKVLAKDPKRNYKLLRVLFFYVKVVVSTLKNINTYRGLNCHLVYITDKKVVLFFRDRILLEFKNSELREKYFFLIKNEILSDMKSVENHFQEPYYTNEEFEMNDVVLQEVVQQYLNPLYALKSISKKGYLKELFERVKLLNMSSEDYLCFESIKSFQFNADICLVISHGDFWSGNIVKHKDSYKLIDWDDIGLRSLTFDIFHFYFQEFNADFEIFFFNYKMIKDRALTTVVNVFNKTNIEEFKNNYDQYFNAFILERMLKRYE